MGGVCTQHTPFKHKALLSQELAAGGETRGQCDYLGPPLLHLKTGRTPYDVAPLNGESINVTRVYGKQRRLGDVPALGQPTSVRCGQSNP